MTAADAPAVMDMMRVFFASPAVLTDGSDEIFRRDIEICVSDDPAAHGWVFDGGGTLVGYSILTRGYSTEYGRIVWWIDDLYVVPEHRGEGIGSAFIQFVRERFPDAMLKLEVEEDNARALAVYRKNGFEMLGYRVMIARQRV